MRLALFDPFVHKLLSVLFPSCIAFNASYDDLATAVESITNSSILVARERITDPGYGYRYWVSNICDSPFIERPGRYVSNFDKVAAGKKCI